MVEYAFMTFKKFNQNLHDKTKANMKAVDIFEVFDNATDAQNVEAPTHYTLGMYHGTKQAVQDATSMGVIKAKISPQKLTYGQVSWLDLGENAEDIVRNLEHIPSVEILRRKLDVALA